MNKNIEKELKLLVSEKQFNCLCKEYEPLNFILQVNQYYDTKDHTIEKKKGAMRIRTKDNKHIFTLKLYENNDLLEYECEVNENSIIALNKPEIMQLLSSYHITGPFIKTASLKTKRAILVNEDAELCFDINEYNNFIDYEIEYEYKRNHDGYQKFNELLSKADLHYESNCKSKIARALNR